MQYDPNDVSVIVDGVYLTGFAESMVTVEKSENNFEVKVGAQGDTLRTRVRNPLGTATVTLLADSPQRKLMDTLANSGQLFSFAVIRAGDEQESVTTEEAYIVKQPNREYGNEIGDREYEIQLLDLNIE
ncbi:DUF3277 family protein [Paenibacillus campinasensis]|uniref:DUF3277 family protein n=1 Tax=Paenibacillus campinasensis TaxID=66347 RepID=A0ABW9T6C7_9BACL|nr:phage protein [Paenibacillus campinasensis]MUG68642.1 DUF3277 family protein [Paenibacillus campinasensis]